MELLKIQTEQFEGPLDLLLFLIQKNELDISAISLHKITDQYLHTIELMRELNFDLASDFLVMAATLLHLKSKRLLPSDDDAKASAEIDDLPTSEEELLRRLREYKKFQEMSHTLQTLPMLNREFFARPGVVAPERQTIWKEISITELTLALQDVLKKNRQRTRIIIREPTSIPEKIATLAKILKVNEMTEFSSVIPEEPTRTDIIVTFIALLELSRLKKLKVYQNETFGSIYLTLTEPLTELDPTLITGFQYKAKKLEEMVLNA